MTVNVLILALLAVIVVISVILLRNQGDIMSTQEDLVREVGDLREAWTGVVEYIGDQDARIQNLRNQLAAAQANTPPETDLSTLVELVDEIQEHRKKLSEQLAPPTAEEATPGPSTSTGIEPLPTADELGTSAPVESGTTEPVTGDAAESETASPAAEVDPAVETEGEARP